MAIFESEGGTGEYLATDWCAIGTGVMMANENTVDREEELMFHYNKRTGKAQWRLPEEVEEEEPPELEDFFQMVMQVCVYRTRYAHRTHYAHHTHHTQLTNQPHAMPQRLDEHGTGTIPTDTFWECVNATPLGATPEQMAQLTNLVAQEYTTEDAGMILKLAQLKRRRDEINEQKASGELVVFAALAALEALDAEEKALHEEVGDAEAGPTVVFWRKAVGAFGEALALAHAMTGPDFDQEWCELVSQSTALAVDIAVAQ
jgi:hypothetical protein